MAEAILFACVHPKRDIYVGFQARIAALVGSIAPWFSDKVMEQYLYWSQRSS